MTSTTHDKVKTAAYQTLHRLLGYLKAKRGLGPKKVLPLEDFFPVDVRLLVKLSGWSVDEVGMVGYTPSNEQILAKCVKAEKRIVLLANQPKERKRYTLAHELGHILLHTAIPECNGGSSKALYRVVSTLPSSRSRPQDEYSRIEREAEVYAREILMPERAVKRHFAKAIGKPHIRAASAVAITFAPLAHRASPVDPRAAADEIATYSASHGVLSLATFFGVSVSSMAIRLNELSLVR